LTLIERFENKDVHIRILNIIPNFLRLGKDISRDVLGLGSLHALWEDVIFDEIDWVMTCEIK